MTNSVPRETVRNRRVIVADDHEPYRREVRAFLDEEHDIEVVAEAGDGQAAVRLARELAPDAVVMDVAMSVMNGIEATRLIVASSPAVKVCALSMHCHRSFVEAMLAAGASGYVLKENALRELAGALRIVIDGGRFVCPDVG